MSGTSEAFHKILKENASMLGFLLTPSGGHDLKTVLGFGIPWAADNGAFTGLDVPKFLRMLARISDLRREQAPMWVTCPDSVGNARETLRLWRAWSPMMREIGLRLAFVLQDGQENLGIPDAECLFVGGTTAYKLSAAAAGLVAEGKKRGCLIHMGRVNSRRRMMYAQSIGCDTVDGTGGSRFGNKRLRPMCRWLAQIESQRVMFQDEQNGASP